MPASQYDPIFEAAAREWNVDPTLLRAVAAQESSGDPRAVSSKGAQGLMGLMPATAKGLGVTDPADPAQNIYGGAKYLNEALTAEKTPEDALGYYHGGPKWRDSYGPESAGYAPAVTAHYQTLAQASAPAGAPPATQPPAQPSAAPPPPAAPPTADADQAAGAALIASMAPGGAKPGTAPPVDPDTATGMALIRSLVPPTGGGSAPAPPTNAPATNGSGGIVANALSGAAQGINDLVSTGANVAKWVDNRVPALARLDSAVGLDPGATASQLDASRKAWEASPAGQSWAGSAGRLGGQVVATAPFMELGGPLLGVAGKGIAAGAGRISPWLGRAADFSNSLAGGTLSASTPGLNVLARGASLATQGVVQGGTAGALLSGQSDAPVWQQAGIGALAGGALGPVAGAAGAGINALAGRAGGVSQPIADLAQLARGKYGIPITAPQLSENSIVRGMSDQSAKLPFSGAGANREAQLKAFQSALDKEAGGIGSATPAAPDVMASNASRIGTGLDRIAARTNIDTNADPQLLNDLADIETRAHSGQVPLAQGGLRSIDANIKGVQDSAAAGNGIIPGDVYQKMTQTGSALDRAANGGDVHTQGYNSEIMDALDRAHQRAATPADQAELGQLRYQYRVMKTLEPLAAKSTDGTIPPAGLMTQVTGQSRRFDPSTGGVAYTGGGNLGELAKIGQQFMKAPADSQTANRVWLNNLVAGTAGAGAVGAAGAALANPASLLAIPAGLAVNRMAGAYLRSGGLANRLIGSSLNPRAVAATIPARIARAGAIGTNALAAPP